MRAASDWLEMWRCILKFRLFRVSERQEKVLTGMNRIAHSRSVKFAFSLFSDIQQPNGMRLGLRWSVSLLCDD